MANWAECEGGSRVFFEQSVMWYAKCMPRMRFGPSDEYARFLESEHDYENSESHSIVDFASADDSFRSVLHERFSTCPTQPGRHAGGSRSSDAGPGARSVRR